MKYEIKHRFTDKVLFSCDVKDSVENKIKCAVVEANLRGADIRGADLGGADLRGADLRGADIRGADLRGVDLRGAKNAPLIITTLDWFVSIDGLGMMRIGCQNHSVISWASFTDEEISEMDGYALEFCNKHKLMLLSICESYKHGEENASS